MWTKISCLEGEYTFEDGAAKLVAAWAVEA